MPITIVASMVTVSKYILNNQPGERGSLFYFYDNAVMVIDYVWIIRRMNAHGYS